MLGFWQALDHHGGAQREKRLVVARRYHRRGARCRPGYVPGVRRIRGISSQGEFQVDGPFDGGSWAGNCLHSRAGICDCCGRCRCGRGVIDSDLSSNGIDLKVFGRGWPFGRYRCRCRWRSPKTRHRWPSEGHEGRCLWRRQRIWMCPVVGGARGGQLLAENSRPMLLVAASPGRGNGRG